MDLSVPNFLFNCVVLFVVTMMCVSFVVAKNDKKRKIPVWSRCLCHFCIINLFRFEVGFKRCTDNAMFFSAYYSFVVFTAKTLVFGKCNFCVFFGQNIIPSFVFDNKKRLRIFVSFFSILEHSSILQLFLQKSISPKFNKSRCCFEIINRLMATARYRRHLIIDFLLQKYIDQYFKIKNLFPIIIYSHRKQSQSFGFHRFGSKKGSFVFELNL